MMLENNSTIASHQQESWSESYARRLKVVREKIYVYLNEPYRDTFDVSDNIVRLSSDAEGLNLALDYARLEADLLKNFEKEVEKAPVKSSVSRVEKDLCEDFKIESLPTSMKKYVEDICKTTDAHPIMVASSVLTMLSGFMGTRVYVPEGIYYQNLYPNLWMLNITKSGAFKSSALSKGSKIAYDYSRQVSDKVKEYYDDIKREIDPQKKHDLHKEMINISRRNPVLPNKITPEALLTLLDQGHGGTIMSNEFGGWLANLENSQHGDLKALFTELYDGYPYRYYTKSQGDFIINKPCFSINGVSNLPWIKEKIRPSDVESGFFARFLLYTPKYSVKNPDCMPEAPGTRQDVFMDENGLKGVLREIRKRHDMYGDIKLDVDSEARKYFKERHEEMYAIIQKQYPHLEERLTPYLKRWSPYMLKVATIMQMVENPRATEIGLAAFQGARSIIWPAIMSTIDLFENHLGMSDHQDKCLKVQRFIEDKYFITEKPLTRQAICASEVLTGGSKEYTEVLTTLVDEGKLSFRAGPTINTNLYTPSKMQTKNTSMPTIKEKEPCSTYKSEEYSADSIERDWKLLSSIEKLDFYKGVKNGRPIDERLQTSSEQTICSTGQAGGTPTTAIG